LFVHPREGISVVKAVNISTKAKTINTLLKKAQRGAPILSSPEEQEFILAEVDDFNREIELTRQNKFFFFTKLSTSVLRKFFNSAFIGQEDNSPQKRGGRGVNNIDQKILRTLRLRGDIAFCVLVTATPR
jgi:hypothetical protein